MCLKAHNVIQGSLCIILSQLNHSMGQLASMRIHQAHWLQGTKEQGILPSRGHFLHRHTALKENFLFKAVGFCLFRINQLLPEMLILLLVHRAINIGRLSLIIAGSLPSRRHIHRLQSDNRGCCIVKIQILLSHKLANILSQGSSR